MLNQQEQASSTKYEVFMVEDQASFDELKRIVDETNPKWFSLDLETDSRHEVIANVYGIGLCFDDNVAYYIPIRNKAQELLCSDSFLADIGQTISAWAVRFNLIGWNLLYDTLVFENNFGINLSEHIYADGQIAKHTVDEERPFALKEVAVRELGTWADKAQEALYASIKVNGGRTTKEQVDMFKADTDVLAEYCGWDTLLARDLTIKYLARIEAEGLTKLFFQDEIMPMYKEVTIDMKRKGFNVDTEHFNKLLSQVTDEIFALEDEIQAAIKESVEPFVLKLLNEKVPVRPGGAFCKAIVELANVPLDRTKSGGFSFAKSSLDKREKLHPEFSDYYKWLRVEAPCPLPEDTLRDVQRQVFCKLEEKRYIFNLNSDAHLRWYFFECLGFKPTDKTEAGLPSVAAEVLEGFSGRNAVADKIISLKKLTKLKSTYIVGMLAEQIDGKIHTSFLQWGTTSGRFSSAGPNLQNLPRIKEDDSGVAPIVLKYANEIKKGFVPPKDYVIVNADYSSLEPVCFAAASGDKKLQQVFRNGEDLYSAIAIETFGITDASANKKAKNYLKDLYPELRQQAKAFCLAVVYGSEAGRVSELLNVPFEEAQRLIDDYLDAYPGLRTYMETKNREVKVKGRVSTKFGRVRHLDGAKRMYDAYGEKILDRKWANQNGLGRTRGEFKNALNNAKNFPIQGLAAHIVNRAMIATSREFKRSNIRAHIVAQVHDEVTCVAHKDDAETAKQILQKCMECTTTIEVPLKAEPVIGTNWADSK